MSILNSLERKYGQYAIENLTAYLIGGQVLLYIYAALNPQMSALFPYEFSRVMTGQWWRVFTFMFIPIAASPIFVVFAWYIYYLYGSVLERHWGSFRYLIYILISYLGALAVGAIFPHQSISNGYIYGSVFLAFAYLYPDFTLLLFFIIPVKVKWLAIITWIGYAGAILLGSWETRVLVLSAVLNFLLFFGSDLFYRMKSKTGKVAKSTGVKPVAVKTYLKCVICGATENDRKIFYWCHDCKPEQCYCEDHIHDHKHRVVN